MAKKLKDLPVGAKVYRPNSKFLGEPVVVQIAHKKSSRIKTITAGVVALRPFDSEEPKNSNSNRRSYGNNRWLHSNIRQFLNAQGIYRFAAQHDADQAPTKDHVYNGWNAYEDTPGFLAGFEKEFIDAILPAENLTAIPSVDGGGTEVVTDKVYLPSITEVGLENDTGVDEGEKWSLFTNNASRIAYPTDSAVADDESGYAKKGEARWYFTRTHSPGSALSVRGVDSDGSRHGDSARSGYGGLRPALDLSPDISVSDKPNADGVYTLEFNAAPEIITSTSTDMGDKHAPFSIVYKVTDKEGDATTITEKLNGVIIREEPIVLGDEREFILTIDQWMKLPIGQESTIEIIATDINGNKNSKLFRFRKSNNLPTMSLETDTADVELYHGSEIALKGKYNDVDKGDVVSVYYRINGGQRRAIAGGISEGVEKAFEKVLRMQTNGEYADILDGETVVANALQKDKKHVVTIWTEDNNGGKTPEETIRFSVVPNRAPKITITETPTASDLIGTDVIRIRGTAVDPDGNDLTMTGQIGQKEATEIKMVDEIFEYKMQVSDLEAGSNIITIVAKDSYGATDIRQVRILIEEERYEAPTSVLRYDLQAPEPITDLIMWIKHKKDAEQIVAHASIHNEKEEFTIMEATEGLSPTGINETEYRHTSEPGDKVTLKFSTLEGATMIMGGMSTDKGGL